LTTIEDRLEKLTWGDKGLKDIYFLHFLCTSPAARGKGVGHKLLTPLMEKVAKEGTEIGLITHTPENVGRAIHRPFVWDGQRRSGKGHALSCPH